MITEDQVRTALGNVIDPAFEKDIVTYRILRTFEIQGDDVLVRLGRGEEIGTSLTAPDQSLRARKQWLADHVQLAGRKVPVIGRISMDLVTIDVTDIPEPDSQPGALVEVLGPHLTADDLAEHARTNAYEVMTALGRRYARHYVDRPETHQ